VASVLALVGVYGVLSHFVGQSTREIGIRLALGASQGAVLRTVVGRGLLIIALGVPLGVLQAVWSGRVVQSFLFGVDPHDSVTFATVIGGVLLAGGAACLLPARRAARVDPVVVLRNE